MTDPVEQTEEPAVITIPKVEIDTTPPRVNHACAVCQHDPQGNETGRDDHPMVHMIVPWTDLYGNTHGEVDPVTGAAVSGPSFHHDCLPEDIVYRLGTDETHPQHRNVRETIKAAKAGVRGDALRDYIHQLARQYNENAVGLGGHHTDGLKGDTTRVVGEPVTGPVGPQQGMPAEIPAPPPYPGQAGKQPTGQDAPAKLEGGASA